MRLDEALVSVGIAETIELARALIMEGRVLYGSEKMFKASDLVKKPELLHVKGELDAYVSRGAHKLKKAFEVFDISVKDKTCIDVGASTGGFTDVMLRQGASHVYCIDVGYNLLDWKLRSDDRITCLEKTNARFLTKELFSSEIEFGATDVSFISLKAILPAVFSVLKKDSDFIALIKPQFEAEKNEVGKKGVVRDIAIHRKVIRSVIEFCLQSDICVFGLDYSPIRGPEGNIEFLLHLRKCAPVDFDTTVITEVTEKAFENFIYR